MALRISGPGVGLSLPQNLYPSELYNAPYDWGTNEVLLMPGNAITIPAGDWAIAPGALSVLQFLDPITGVWRMNAAQRGQTNWVRSDGYTRRIANLTGCPIGAVVAGGGTSFTQATCTVTASVGGSTWQPIVGGSLSVSSIVNAGKNYGMPPIVAIPEPPSPGVAATAYCALTSGTVSSVSLTNFGAGYTAATVTALLLPNPADPNAGSVTVGSVNFVLANAGAITAVLCTNNGSSLASITAMTLTAAGGSGSGATITPVVMCCVTATSIVAGGVGWGTATAFAKATTVGGQPVSVSAINNPEVEFTGYRPRDANITATTNAAGTITALTVIDAGLFVGQPTAAVQSGGTVPTTAASITYTMGGSNDVVIMQPL